MLNTERDGWVRRGVPDILFRESRRQAIARSGHLYALNSEFDIQPINERLMWVYGMIYGVIQAVFVVYAPTNKKDNVQLLQHVGATSYGST